ncbi:MAG TPA: glycosyltransferase [Acidimicrobiales bacterium]|nr:glycosyltransferase [Acidimicrobiales bacterium]
MSGRWERLLPLGLFLAAYFVLRGSSLYGMAAFGLLGAKLLVSTLHRPAPGGPSGAERNFVTVVVPVYNEDPQLFVNCLRSVVEQTRRPDKIHVVDDGSRSKDALAAVEPVLEEARRRGIQTEVTVFRRNRGKREAQGMVFRSCPEATIFFTIDSDTVLGRNALREGLKPFSDERVMCVTGLVMAVNSERNVLTRLIHLRYVNAFMWERAAYSMVGSVLCACGALALYRADIIREHLDDYLNQRFLGRPAVFGDDRRLTNYALLHGRVVLQPSAVGETAVPERITHFVRQQLRWNKSFMRESIWVVQNMPLRHMAFWLTVAELSSWAVFTVTLTVTLLLASFHAGMSALGTYLALVCLMSYVRSARYFSAWREQGKGVVSGLVTFVIAPLYGALHLLLLLPLRTVAALTLFRGSWGTRSHVEVRVEGGGLPPAAYPRTPPAPDRGAESGSAARIDAAVAAWDDGWYEAALAGLEAELGGPCAAMAQGHLDRLHPVVDRLSAACRRQYERRLVPWGDDWSEVVEGFQAWAAENVIGLPLAPGTPKSTAPSLDAGVVSSIREIRSIEVVSAAAVTRDWSRLTLALDTSLTGTCVLPRPVAAQAVVAGDVVRVLELLDGDEVSVAWEGSAELRVTLEARIVDEPRRDAPAPAPREPVSS